MRKGDAPSTQAKYRQVRGWQSAYGVLVSLIGFALMVWLPVDDDWLRLGTGWLVVLLGGMMVSPQVVRDWLALVAELVPILRPVLKNKK